MSNQEMQFNDPTWRSPEQRNRNADMREQSAYAPQPINWDQDEQEEWQIPPHSQQDNYVGELPYIGPQPQKIGVGEFSGKSSRHRSPWAWLILVLIVLAILGAGSGSHFRRGGFETVHPENSVTESHNFSVSPNGHPIIIINNAAGTIHVDVGNSKDNVSINAVRQDTNFPGNPQDLPVSIKQNGDTIIANVDNGVNPFNSRNVEFDVTVPANTDLQLKTDSGSIEVNGVNGKMSLTTDTGSITANGDTLANQSSFHTNTGSITFDGATNEGNYSFQTDTGSVNLIFPANSSFHLDATTDTGSINSDFPVKVETNNSFGGQVHSDVGTPSSTEVSIKTATGSITLNKG